MEPIINDGNPEWLCIKKEEIIPVVSGRSTEQSIKEPLDPEIKITFSTRDAGLWQCKKCEATIQSDKKPDYCNACKRDSTFERITKKVNLNRWKIPHWKEIPTDELDMEKTYNNTVTLVKKCVVFLEEIQYKLFSLWIIASYKNNSFDSVPFLIFRGLIESGKTRALAIIRELGYRMVHTTGVTFPAMCRLTHFHNAGILIDEIDNKIDKRTEDGRKYLDFLKPSYKRGSIYTVADNEDQEETKEYKNFGFKAMAGEKGGFDDATFSRSIVYDMEQGYPEVTELKCVQGELDDLQTILLNYRYKFDDPAPLPQGVELKGRNREIFCCLIQTAELIGIEYDDILEYIQQRAQEKTEEIQDSDECKILEIIKSKSEVETLDDAPEHLQLKEIVVSWRGETIDDEVKKKMSMKLSYILRKKLFLKTKRRSDGTVLLLSDYKNARRLKSLYRRFKI